MKKLFFIAVSLIVVMAVSSCKKCVTCQYEYDYVGQKVTKVFPQKCGSSKDVNTYKDAAEAEAKRYGTAATCTTDK